ncbi:MAG: hypothetical protein A2744_04350 [Candidatus Buchananbacteria bacterium RIFCSPHIGHO2_01_FULL_44_11]|uniref:Prepilin-type N-terminal cleavage/methylation domain-containing protein n=1 Tax=Candidatus Buchananbacteria bacterium RIFCSPHIGHO2_01_FULL_44_11 TaxID=1797535 RepID=A0A1G1Y1F4_9BACT|nr:MAG: hypothetical protein A2744_04350 [Candidatus Buchananbacteria bacterium RIFCSPHIGHO2_01_FULL_44_11]
MKNLHRNHRGFTAVEIMIVVAIIGILVAIAVPGFYKARIQSREHACQENLTKIDSAVEKWALEGSHPVGSAVSMADLLSGGYLKEEPKCPDANGGALCRQPRRHGADLPGG